MKAIRLTLALVLVMGFALAAVPSAGAAGASSRFEVYTAVVSMEQARDLQQRYDHDVLNATDLGDGRVSIDLVLNRVHYEKLLADGISVELKRDEQGRTFLQAEAAHRKAAAPVFRTYLGSNGIKA